MKILDEEWNKVEKKFYGRMRIEKERLFSSRTDYIEIVKYFHWTRVCPSSMLGCFDAAYFKPVLLHECNDELERVC
jgi:hypothetical protein